MNEQELKALREMLAEMKGNVGRAVEVLPKIEALEKKLTERDTDAKTMRDGIEALKADLKARADEIAECRRQQQVRIDQDPARSKRQALIVLGAQLRQSLARAIGSEIPGRFSDERAVIEDYAKQRATLQAGSSPGSLMIPTMLEADFNTAMEDPSTIAGQTDYRPNLPGNIDVTVLTGRFALKGKRSSVDNELEKQEPAFTQLSIAPEEMSIFVPVDNRLLEMEAIGLASQMMPLLMDSFVDGIGYWALRADGTAAFNSLTGVLNNGTYKVAMPAGKKSFRDLSRDDLLRVKVSTLQRIQNRGKFYLGAETLASIGDLDRQGKVALVTQMNGKTLVDGNEVVVDQYMPVGSESAADKPLLAFGDMAAMVVGLKAGVQVDASREYYFGKNQTCFRLIAYGDIKRKPANLLTVLRTAAA